MASDVCGDQYTSNTKTRFCSRANNCKNAHRMFLIRKGVPKEVL